VEPLQSKGRFDVILADPPWKYRDSHSGREFKHGSIDKYPTMTLQQICDFPVPKIAMEDCALFLWITVPLLPYGFDILKVWGFEYKTSLYWNKKNSLGLGNWFRNNIEQCLIGIRGNIRAFNLQMPNIIHVQPNGHSKKPRCIYSILESLDLDPKIELFARDRRDGWDCYGNELSNTVQRLIT